MERILDSQYINENQVGLEKSNIDDLVATLVEKTDLSPSQKQEMRTDFYDCIKVLQNRGASLEEIRIRLLPQKMGLLYKKQPGKFYPIDNGAKQYPIVMTKESKAMFRISAELMEPVIIEVLQVALIFTLKRFPHFATKIGRGLFWYHLKPQVMRYQIEQEGENSCMPMDLTKKDYQLFRVLYSTHSISVEVLHILTDGMGGVFFIKSLLAEYFRLLGENIDSDEQIVNPLLPTVAEDTENCFEQFYKNCKPNPMVRSAAARMSGELTISGEHKVWQYHFSANALKVLAKEWGVTITALMAAVILSTCRKVGGAEQENYVLQVPINLRSRFKCSTLRNFSWFCGIHLPKEESIKEIAKAMQEELLALTSKDNLSEEITAAQKTIRLLRFVPLRLKELLLKTTYFVSGDIFFTGTLSNLGKIDLPNTLQKHVQHMSATLGPSVSNNLVAAMMTLRDSCIVNVTKATKDVSFEMEFEKRLERLDIAFEKRY